MVKLGSAFSDNVVVDGRRRSHAKEDPPWWAGAGRALMFVTVLCIGFFVLLWRLFDLTVIHGLEYRKLSDNNRTRALVRHAPRGLLLDRTGKPLVSNTPQYRLLKPCEQGGVAECVSYLDQQEGDRLVKQGDLPAGEYVEVDYQRRYLFGEALAHVVGYIGELSADELASDYYKTRNYGLGDRVGRMGAEEVYNERLRGRDGKEYVEIDSSGRIIRTLGRVEELAGEDMFLSLDAGLSTAARDAFPAGEKGAVVVSKPSTGEILAMYSSPGFSPDAFITGMSQSEYDALVHNPDLPMFNRAIGGVYPPGSTFKILTSIAGIEEGMITKDTTVEDSGTISIGPFSFPNWYFLQYGKTDGTVDVTKALQRSNDIFFYKAGEWIGITKLAEWAKKIGIGKPLGIELSGETGGLMPDPAWKKTRFDSEEDKLARNDEWYLGDTYHISIGQGYLLTTPLAVNAWTNIIANGGKKCRPTIEKSKKSKVESQKCKDLNLKKETLDLIIRGMEEACAIGGTGWPLFNFTINKVTNSQSDNTNASSSATTAIHIPIGCKTGTAEFGDPKNHTHAWFTSFAPLPSKYIPDDIKQTEQYIDGSPEISVTVLVEGAGEGSSVAAPVAKKIYEEWFSR